MAKITSVEGRGIVVEGNDIDTDQIIPARYLKEITFERMGQYAFFDLRYAQDGSLKEHPFNDPKYKGASILIVNSNFGCGSSREHAPQALVRSGIRAFIGESFSEIFSGNCTALGAPIITLPKAQVQEIQRAVEADPSLAIRIDIVGGTVTVGDKVYTTVIPPQIKEALAGGTWDTTNVMLEHDADITRVYNSLPYIRQNF